MFWRFIFISEYCIIKYIRRITATTDIIMAATGILYVIPEPEPCARYIIYESTFPRIRPPISDLLP